MTDADEVLKKGKERKAALEKSLFKQQALPAWRPNPTFLTTLVTFMIFGIIFLVLGLLLFLWGNRIKEAEITYHITCRKQIEEGAEKCVLDLNIPHKMEAPVFVYYQIDNLFQNHRRYVRSRSNAQLRGNQLSVDDVSGDCHPIVTNKHLGRTTSINNRPLDPDAAAHPCGLIAQSYFNDTFELQKVSAATPVDINPKGIAWDTDVSDLFANMPGDYETYQWTDVTDERFIVWMRVAGMKNFRKPWGIIHEDLPEGDYKLTIEDNYPVSSFQGQKKFFMSTTDTYGGRNRFLAISYIVVGALCIFFALVFLFAFLRQKKKNQ